MKMNKPNYKTWFIKNLFLMLTLSGFLIGLLAALFLPQPITGKYYEFLICSLVFSIWGFSGLVLVIRKEITQFPLRIKGKPVVFYGLLIMITSWALALMLLFMAVAKFQ